MFSVFAVAAFAVSFAASAAGDKINPTSPTSHVKGKAFDRFAIVWLENTDYDKSAGDPNLAWLAKKGITLTNYHAVTHPSQPNYCASVSGDYFGMNHDDFIDHPENVFTVVDLLEDKGISWGEYQEDMPSTGYRGLEYLNQDNGANDYVRKHNPAVNFARNSRDDKRRSVMKSLKHFYTDLENDKLPQWMFITPNMTSDGHDSSVTTAGSWTRNFLEPLLDDEKFMQNTLVLVTWDENHTYTMHNRIMGIILGDAVPKRLVGTKDSHFYNHYSELATVQANWGLHTLGRFDVGANVFSLVAQKTGDVIRRWTQQPLLNQMYFNLSYAGKYNDEDADNQVPWPAPNIKAKHAGRTVLPAIVDAWTGKKNPSYYSTRVETFDGMHPPPGYELHDE